MKLSSVSRCSCTSYSGAQFPSLTGSLSGHRKVQVLLIMFLTKSSKIDVIWVYFILGFHALQPPCPFPLAIPMLEQHTYNANQHCYLIISGVNCSGTVISTTVCVILYLLWHSLATSTQGKIGSLHLRIYSHHPSLASEALQTSFLQVWRCCQRSIHCRKGWTWTETKSWSTPH